MADATMGAPGAARPGLFLRNATGLVKSWSTFDAFVYSFWSVNLITLGLYGMSFVYWVPDAQLLAAIVRRTHYFPGSDLRHVGERHAAHRR